MCTITSKHLTVRVRKAFWIPAVRSCLCSPVEHYICGRTAPQRPASLCRSPSSLKDSLVPIDSCSLNILRHSAGTYVSSVIYWTGVCGERMNDNQAFVRPQRCSRTRSLWSCFRGRLGGAAGPSVSPRQSQRPSAAGPKPHWDLKSCYTVS